MKLDGKVAVITGGEGNLGKAVNGKFLAEGAKLVIGWHASDEWEETKGLLSDTYRGKFIDVRTDVTKEEQVENLMKKAKDAFGSIDILLHMVGHPHFGKTIWETDTADFEELLNVNLKSAFLCSKHAISAMLEKGTGRIVFFPAKGALEPRGKSGAYSIAKTGLVTLMLTLREELIDTDITVNCVAPSTLNTPKLKNLPNVDPAKTVKPSDIAELLCSICADEGKILSGSILKVYGKM